MKNKIIGIILAAGKSERTSLPIPKQFYTINNKPVIWYSLNAFVNNSDITDIICVIPEKFIKISNKIASEFINQKQINIIIGGKTRQESSYIALQHCDKDTKYVLIHDAARVMVTDSVINKVIIELNKYKAVTSACKVTDSVAMTNNDEINSYYDRKSLIHIQTPQGFDYNTIFQAHKFAKEEKFCEATDDCSLIAKCYPEKIKVVFLLQNNFKITTSEDITVAQALLNTRYKHNPEYLSNGDK